MSVCTPVYVQSVCMDVCVYVGVYVCAREHVHTLSHTHIHIYMFIYIFYYNCYNHFDTLHAVRHSRLLLLMILMFSNARTLKPPHALSLSLFSCILPVVYLVSERTHFVLSLRLRPSLSEPGIEMVLLTYRSACVDREHRAFCLLV